MNTQVAVQERTQSNAPTSERRATPVENFAHQVMGDTARQEELFRALPNHIPPARFQRNFFNLLMQKPEILQYDPRLVYREVSKAAGLGLSLDPQFAEADIVPVWNPKTGRKEPELRPRYKGLIKLARQSGEVADIYPGEVKEEDHWIEKQGTERRLEHQIDRRKPRGNSICYYAVVVYKDGTKDFEVMDIEQIYAIRAKSEGWNAYQNKKIKSTPWVTDEGEMCKKTVLKRLLKRVPQSSDLADAIALDHDREPLQTIDLPSDQIRSAQTPSIGSRLDQFAQNGNGQAADSETESSASSLVSDEAEGEEASTTSDAPEESASSTVEQQAPAPREEGADSAAATQMSASEKDAYEKGRAARQSKYGRASPRNLKSKAAETAAFLRGWDDEDAEAAAEENGTV